MPGLTKSLISVGSMTDDGYELLFDSSQIHVLENFELLDDASTTPFWCGV